jgi:hypothetical protein
VLAGIDPGGVVAIHSTVHPGTVEGVAAAAPSSIDVLDAPISGGVPGARGATLCVMVGGDAAAFEQARPVFECFGNFVVHLVPLGAGLAAKLVRNLMGYVSMLGAQEGRRLAEGAGVDLEVLRRILDHTGAVSPMMRSMLDVPGGVDGTQAGRLALFKALLFDAVEVDDVDTLETLSSTPADAQRLLVVSGHGNAVDVGSVTAGVLCSRTTHSDADPAAYPCFHDGQCFRQPLFGRAPASTQGLFDATSITHPIVLLLGCGTMPLGGAPAYASTIVGGLRGSAALGGVAANGILYHDASVLFEGTLELLLGVLLSFLRVLHTIDEHVAFLDTELLQRAVVRRRAGAGEQQTRDRDRRPGPASRRTSSRVHGISPLLQFQCSSDEVSAAPPFELAISIDRASGRIR